MRKLKRIKERKKGAKLSFIQIRMSIKQIISILTVHTQRHDMTANLSLSVKLSRISKKQ